MLWRSRVRPTFRPRKLVGVFVNVELRDGERAIASRFGILAVVLTGMSGLIHGADTADPGWSFAHDVRPLLANHCFACHGPDEQHRSADLRLDIAGPLDAAELLRRIRSSDPDEIMPPPETNKPLRGDQIRVLERWIEQGTPYQQHWAFVPPRNPTPPPTEHSSWSDQPLDRFVLATMESAGLQPSPVAEKRTLIRRVTLDLTGLPPTREEIRVFLSDHSAQAYENLVDRLLSSPAYGEHMARYWLDLVRFADSNGRHHDHYREQTPYRDWVIRCFNNNLPMDDFIRYQLAGDLYDEPSQDQLIGSGFHRLHLIIDVGTAIPEESFFLNVVDRVSAFGTVFMGLSLQCAVCHDHKYDPLSQREFFQLSAFFNNLDATPETGGRGTDDFLRGLHPPYIHLPSAEQQRQLEQLEADLKSVDARLHSLGRMEELNSSGPNERLVALTSERQRVEQERDELLKRIPAALIMKERSEIRPAHVMIRGAYDQPGDMVSRGVPSCLPPLTSEGKTATRMDLADWLTDPEHPLTARVAVNRFWQQLFGVGLVKTSEDFGAQGESPTHPELLDYLAVDFVRSGWDVKAFMRRIVLSKTYQQTSVATPERYRTDPENRLLARGSRFRLDAEVIRDQLLATTGLLSATLYGKSVKPPQPPGLWKLVLMPTSYPHQYQADHGEQIYRRSIYTYWRRGLPPPPMTIFDAPTRETCIARRERTNTPLQALALMNEPQYFAAAMHYAELLLNQSVLDDRERIAAAYESITARQAGPATVARLEAAREGFRRHYDNEPAAAAALIEAHRMPEDRGPVPESQVSELASWTLLVHSLLNLDQTKTRE